MDDKTKEALRKYVNDMRRFTQHLFEQDAHLAAKIKNINNILPFFVNEIISKLFSSIGSINYEPIYFFLDCFK